MIQVIYTTYLPKQNKWLYGREYHASLSAARIRAKVKGWSIVKASRVKLPALLREQAI